MTTERKRRPTLTKKAIEGLRSVRKEAHDLVADRRAEGETWSAGKGGLDEKTWRGIEYIDALVAWFEARQAAKAKKR